MPATINGIGTHYYGSRNRTTRNGVCKACGVNARLDSYDTRLWFVVLFVPIIPLGRKRITDQCSRCRRHWVSSQKVFDQLKRDSITEAMSRYQAQPSPEAALELHARLLAFRLYDKAEPFRKLVLEQYPDSETLLAGLAMQVEQIGRPSEAAAFFEKAFELKPDLPAARLAVAGLRIAEGKLDEARELLTFLESPGAGKLYPLARLESLARAYQQAGRHAESLELFRRLLAERPELGQIKAFRKLVLASEKAMRSEESMLPRQVFSIRNLFGGGTGGEGSWRRGLAIAAVIAVVAAIGLAIANEYVRRHRTVFAATGGGLPVQASIDGQPPVAVGPLTKLQLAEGRHHLKLSGAIDDEFDIELETGYFTRWTNNPVWVINVDGRVALAVGTLHYAIHPRPSGTQIVLGQRVFRFAHVDYPFEAAPQTIQVDSHGGETTKIRLDRIDRPAHQLFYYAMKQFGADQALQFAETCLRHDRDDSLLLYAYIEGAMAQGKADRAVQFLKAGLEQQPISIPWHRVYQDLNRTPEQRKGLPAFYDALLKKRPDDARLLYLRGRVEDDPAKSREFFHRACAADAALAWPWMALAYDAASSGDWQQSRTLADRAFALKLGYPGLKEIRHEARLATGDTAAMETEYRLELQSGPPEGSVSALINLCDVLAAQGKTNEGRQALADWENRIPANERSPESMLAVRQSILYLFGDFAALQQMDPRQAAETNPTIRLHVLVNAGRPKDVIADAQLLKFLEYPWNALAVSLSFHLSGSRTEADTWREKACAGLEQLDANGKRAAVMLRGSQAPSLQELQDIVFGAKDKALFAAALAIRFPQQKSAFAALASRLNVSRTAPYYLVQKAIGR